MESGFLEISNKSAMIFFLTFYVNYDKNSLVLSHIRILNLFILFGII